MFDSKAENQSSVNHTKSMWRWIYDGQNGKTLKKIETTHVSLSGKCRYII